MTVTLSGLFFGIDLLVIILVALRQLDRFMRNRFMGRQSPALLLRDLIFFWSVVLLLLLSTVATVLDVDLTADLPWIVLRGVIGTIALLVWFYYEFFIIGRDDET